MPRYPRSLSESGIYHVMIRGVNKMPIFLDQDDNARFLDTLTKIKSQGEYTLYAYCLMKNHAHLLIKEEGDSLSRTMKRIGVSYSYYFNKKHDRVGHLFQDRFRSERIETDDYLLSCIRYIHNNPVKASIVNDPSNYKWSSYNIYINKAENEGEIISTELILNMFSENKNDAIRRFEKFTTLSSEDGFIDIEELEKNVEDDKLNRIEAILKDYNLTLKEFAEIKDRKTRTAIIKEIDSSLEISAREMSKLIGWSRDTIMRDLRR